jgi:hypothetical protein
VRYDIERIVVESVQRSCLLKLLTAKLLFGHISKPASTVEIGSVEVRKLRNQISGDCRSWNGENSLNRDGIARMGGGSNG